MALCRVSCTLMACRAGLLRLPERQGANAWRHAVRVLPRLRFNFVIVKVRLAVCGALTWQAPVPAPPRTLSAPAGNGGPARGVCGQCVIVTRERLGIAGSGWAAPLRDCGQR